VATELIGSAALSYLIGDGHWWAMVLGLNLGAGCGRTRGVGMHKILVSGCLNGRPIRFNSTNVSVESEIWDRWVSEKRLVAFCPELAAGFPVPRAPAEIVGSTAAVVLAGGGRVEEDNGTDVTDMFVDGTRLAAQRARAEGCVMAVLTDGGPSCGTTYTYDGTFNGGTVEGMGVTAQLLHDHGL
jgi:uncharacterized protein YbbK (DUF523 family)